MIYLYTGPGCPTCIPAKEWLDNRGVNYEEINVGEDPEALEYLNMMNISSVPTLEFSDEEPSIPLIGFSHQQYDKEFRKRGL